MCIVHTNRWWLNKSWRSENKISYCSAAVREEPLVRRKKLTKQMIRRRFVTVASESFWAPKGGPFSKGIRTRIPLFCELESPRHHRVSSCLLTWHMKSNISVNSNRVQSSFSVESDLLITHFHKAWRCHSKIVTSKISSFFSVWLCGRETWACFIGSGYECMLFQELWYMKYQSKQKWFCLDEANKSNIGNLNMSSDTLSRILFPSFDPLPQEVYRSLETSSDYSSDQRLSGLTLWGKT